MTAVPCVASEPKVSTVSSDATDASSAAAGAGAAAAATALAFFLDRRPRRPLRSGDRGSSTMGAPADADVATVGSVTTEAEAEAKVPTSKSTDATDACDTASSSVFFGRSFRASAAAPRQMAAGSTQ